MKLEVKLRDQNDILVLFCSTDGFFYYALVMKRGSQKVSKIAIGIVAAAWLIVAICFFIALSKHHWLWLLSIFKYVILP